MLWKCKLGRDLDEVLHLLNGKTQYDRPVPDARVCMAWRGDHPRFWVFAKKAAKSRVPGDGTGRWQWKLAFDADDVLRFLRGAEPYSGPVAEAQVVTAWTGTHHRFHVFYRATVPGRDEAPPVSDWQWTCLTDPKDTLALLNGSDCGDGPVVTARIATAHRNHRDEYFVFYSRARRGGRGETEDVWRWHRAGSSNDVRRVVERGNEQPLDFQVAAPPLGYGLFQVFTAPQGGPDPAEPVAAGLCRH
jgi:hypothetical protein